MKAYGYKMNGEKILSLRDVTFRCDIGELDKIIEFFQNVKEESEEYSKVVDESQVSYWQYRDWDKKWKENLPDIIAAVLFDGE